MKKVLKIDKDGFFIEDVILHEEVIPSDCIEIECPQGFYKPKWNGDEWIEGLTPQEIEELKKIETVPQQPSIEERIAALEILMMGVI